MRQACLEKRIVATPTGFFDPSWWRRTKWVLRNLLQEKQLEQYKRRHDAHCGAMLYLADNPRCFDDHWEQAEEIRDQMRRMLTPWTGEVRATAAKSLLNIWEAEYGKMDSPETQKRIDETIRRIHDYYKRTD